MLYIQEILSGVHTITGARHRSPLFVGPRIARRCQRAGPYREFSAISAASSAASRSTARCHARCQQFFQNGGRDALIVRVYHRGDRWRGETGAERRWYRRQGTLTVANNPVDGDRPMHQYRTYRFRRYHRHRRAGQADDRRATEQWRSDEDRRHDLYLPDGAERPTASRSALIVGATIPD